MTSVVYLASDEGIDDSRNDAILGRLAQKGMVDNLELKK
jgi:hypothetical protein